MGVGAVIALTAVSAAGQIAGAIGKKNQAKSATRAAKWEALIAMDKRKKEIERLVAKQKVGYVEAGVRMEGTPENVIKDTINTGNADVMNIYQNYRQGVKNQLTAARAELLGSISQVGMNIASMGMSAMSNVPTFDVTNQASNIASASGGQINMTNASYFE